MKSNVGIILAVVVGAVLLMSMSSTGNAIDLSAFVDQYGQDNVNRLQAAANALAAQGISGNTLLYCLAQVLQETGIFTSGSANYNATDNDNNYSGISNANGSLKQYNSANDWATEYISIISRGPNYPIQATSISDFNTRLKANGYYTDSAATYGANLNYYYNLLNS